MWFMIELGLDITAQSRTRIQTQTQDSTVMESNSADAGLVTSLGPELPNILRHT